MGSVRFRSWHEQENLNSNKRALFAALMISLWLTVRSWRCYAEMQNYLSGFQECPWGRDGTSIYCTFNISSSCYRNLGLRPNLSETFAEQSPTRRHRNPRQINNWKLMGPAQKSDFSQLQLEQTQKQTCFLWISRGFLSLFQWTSPISMPLITCEWQLYPEGS